MVKSLKGASEPPIINLFAMSDFIQAIAFKTECKAVLQVIEWEKLVPFNPKS